MNYNWQPMSNQPPGETLLDLWVRGPEDDIRFYCDAVVKMGGLHWEGRANGWVLWHDGKWRMPRGVEPLQHPLAVTPLYWKYIELGPVSG